MASDSLNQVLQDRAAEIPLYRRIEENLLTQIAEGDLEPGEMIPPEWELWDHYGVSRITVRRAISELQTRIFRQFLAATDSLQPVPLSLAAASERVGRAVSDLVKHAHLAPLVA